MSGRHVSVRALQNGGGEGFPPFLPLQCSVRCFYDAHGLFYRLFFLSLFFFFSLFTFEKSLCFDLCVCV